MKLLKVTPALGYMVFALTLTLISCQPTIENALPTVINKPFKSLDVQPNQYAIRADRDTVVTTETGTHIGIAANTLVDASNNPVKGSVVLTFEEFHNPTDILISGIPMEFDSAGTKYGFESAGMFNIAAKAENGEEVFIKEGSTVDIDMASFREGNDFSFYFLDTTDGQWQTLGRKDAVENTEKKETLDSLSEKIAAVEELQAGIIQPKRYKPGDKILNLDINYSKLPELRPFHALIWRYAGTGGKDDPESHMWIYEEQWKTILLEPIAGENGKYNLKLGNKTKSFATIVEPVLQGKDLEKAEQQVRSQMAEYNKVMTEYKNEAMRVEREANLLRSFTVANFGIYNWDRFYKEKDMVKVVADFKFDKIIPGSEKATIYLVINSRNAVIQYHPGYTQLFSFMPGEDNKLIAVMPDESIAVYSQQDFEALAKRIPNNGAEITITLKVTSKKIEKSTDVDNLLASL